MKKLRPEKYIIIFRKHIGSFFDFMEKEILLWILGNCILLLLQLQFFQKQIPIKVFELLGFEDSGNESTEMNAGCDYGLGFSRIESSLGKIFNKIPSLNASQEGDLSCFQFRESRCCVWAGTENNEGKHSWKGGICWYSLTQLLEVKEATKWVMCLERLDVLRVQECPARDLRMVRQRVQGGVRRVSRPSKTHACVKPFFFSVQL